MKRFSPDRKFYLSVLITLVSISSLFVLRTIPLSQLWKGYCAVYVKSEKLTDENIIQLFSENSVKDVIYLEGQKLPVYSKLAPVQSQSQNSWVSRRKGFFRDSTGTYRIFYVPESQKKKAEKTVLDLNRFGDTFAGTDSSATFPWIKPFITLLTSLMLIYFSKKKAAFISSVPVIIIFAFTRPFYTVCAAGILLLSANYLMQYIFDRKGFLSDSKNAVYVAPLVLIPAILLFVSSPLDTILFILTAAGSWSSVIVFKEIKTYIDQKNGEGIRIIYIKNSSSVQILNKKTIKILAGSVTSIIILLLCSFLFYGNINTSHERPELPAPGITNSEISLPDFQDFLDWSWITVSYPYRKLDQNLIPSEILKGDSVSIRDYSFDANGNIKSTVNKVLTYDSSFCSSIYDTVNKLNYPSLEKMMIKQGKNSKYGYTSTSGSSSEKAVVIILLFFITVPGSLCLYYLTGRTKKWH